ncbi:MAG TPA: tetratricopeptide repeat protein, partial [Polyangiaceae bacterium]|nr:tetratricopeptide repeat protein [Polyangiaceae bacterium]
EARAASSRGLGEEDEFDAFPTESGKPSGSKAGSADGYGDVVLEGGGGDLDLGENLDRGEAPEGMPRGPTAAASAVVDLSAPARPEKFSDAKSKAKKRRKTSAMSKGTRIALFSILGLAVAGGALASLIPDVGPYGVYFVMDRLKAGQYREQLLQSSKVAQKRMGLDTAKELANAFHEVRAGLNDAPRFHPRAAYAAYIGFFHQLRFLTASDESAQAQALMDSLKEAAPDTEYLELAQLAQKAAQGHPEVPADLATRLLGRGIDYVVLVGESALAKRRVDVAVTAWTKALAMEKSARTHFGLARAHYLANQPQAVREQLDLALKANPAHAGARILEATLKLADRSLDEGILQELAPFAEGKASASRGEQVQALVLMGELHLERGRLKKAEEAFTLALSKDAGSASAQRNLARVLFESGRYSEALARYESALSVEPDDLKISLGIVQCKLRLEQLQDAVKMLDQLAPRHPNSTALLYWIGIAKEAAGEKDVAQASYEKAIKQAEAIPELVLAYVGLTKLLGQKGHHAEAAVVIAQAQQRFPDDPAVFRALGELAVGRGSFDEAVRHFDRAIALDPHNVALHFSKGVALRQARRFDEAVREFDMVEQDSKDYPGLALERGNLYEASGRSEDALKAYELALAAAPDDLDLKLRVACGKAAAGQAQAAIEQLKPILEARPNSGEVNFCQGLALLAS